MAARQPRPPAPTLGSLRLNPALILISTAPLFPDHTRSVAIFSDVHGNIRALDAVLDDIAAQDIDAVICNGDLITSSAHAEAVVQRLRASGIPCTRGNHERYLAELADPADPKWRQDNWLPTRHDFHSLSADDRLWLTQLPDTLWLCDGPAPLIMAHAAPGHDTARLSANTTPAEWDAIFSGLPPGSTLIGSHLHMFWLDQTPGRSFVRTPSAGLPLDGDTRAGYIILRRGAEGWQVEHRRVGYNLQAELDNFSASDYYRAGGLIAHLFWEELRSARWWIVPFFAHLRRVTPAAALTPGQTGFDAETLAAAWRTFNRSACSEYNPDAPGYHR